MLLSAYVVGNAVISLEQWTHSILSEGLDDVGWLLAMASWKRDLCSSMKSCGQVPQLQEPLA